MDTAKTTFNLSTGPTEGILDFLHVDQLSRLIDNHNAARLLLTTLAILVIVPKALGLIKNVFSPIFSVPGPLLNKLTSWPLTVANLKGTSHHFARELHDKYGPVVVLAPNMIAITDAHEIKRIIQTEDWPKSLAVFGNFRQDPERPTLIAFTEKEPYRQRKRMMSTMFGIKYIRSMEPLMKDCVRVALKTVGETCDKSAPDAALLDLQHLIHSLAIDIIGITTFGDSFHVVENGAHPLPDRLKAGLKLSGLALLIPWIRSIPFIPARDPYIDSFTYDIVEKRRAQVKNNEVPRQDLLQKLVEASDETPGSTFRRSDVQDESVILLTAGSETTANAELFTLIMLLKNPDKLRKVYEEVDQWYPPTDKEKEVDCNYSLTGMTYLQACQDETMRLVPGQATGSPREASKPEIISGYKVPAGTTVFPSTQGAQMDPKSWSEPEKFLPERWLGFYSSGKPIDTVPAYWPFSAGSRVCVGKSFALQEMHLSLVALLRAFEFEYVPGQDEKTVFRVAQQLQGSSYMVKVKRRNHVR